MVQFVAMYSSADVSPYSERAWYEAQNNPDLQLFKHDVSLTTSILMWATALVGVGKAKLLPLLLMQHGDVDGTVVSKKEGVPDDRFGAVDFARLCWDLHVVGVKELTMYFDFCWVENVLEAFRRFFKRNAFPPDFKLKIYGYVTANGILCGESQLRALKFENGEFGRSFREKYNRMASHSRRIIGQSTLTVTSRTTDIKYTQYE